MDSNLMFTHLTSAAICAYVLQLLQQWKALPWITAHTTWLNVALRALLSGASAVGIHSAWTGTSATGWQIVIGIPAASVLAHGLFEWVGQYSLQHGLLKIFQLQPVPPTK
jgi:hypothetical protein